MSSVFLFRSNVHLPHPPEEKCFQAKERSSLFMHTTAQPLGGAEAEDEADVVDCRAWFCCCAHFRLVHRGANATPNVLLNTFML